MPPYTFEKIRKGSKELFIVDIMGYKRFTINGKDEFRQFLNGDDCDPILLNVLKFVEEKKLNHNHSKPMKSFLDAVLVFALFDNMDINDALEELNEKGYVLSRDKTTGVFPKNSGLDIIKHKKEFKVTIKGRDILVNYKDKSLLYRDFMNLRKLFNIYRFYINNWDTPALIGEFKYGYIVKAPYV